VVAEGERRLVIRRIEREWLRTAWNLGEYHVADPRVRTQHREVRRDQEVERDVGSVEIDSLVDVLVGERDVGVAGKRAVRHYGAKRNLRETRRNRCGNCLCIPGTERRREVCCKAGSQ